MKGDFTRNTFAPDKHFLRVLMQQGRVQLDSDWNEQASILLHYMQTLASDLIGPYAGPAGENAGFAISNEGSGEGDFTIGKGRYYVNGILCENEQDMSYVAQPDYPLPSNIESGDGDYMVYLDVWERHISFVEDDDIREKALNGVDTATRSKVVWQVKTRPLENQYAYCHQGASVLTDNVLVVSQICMSARVKPGQTSDDPCLTAPEAQYRGAENQLYRVEIHTGNLDEGGQVQANIPTFKFSRENGSVIFPVKDLSYDAGSKTSIVELEHLGRDNGLGICEGNWVELVDDAAILQNRTMPLLQVLEIDAIERKVTLSGGKDFAIDINQHALLRRWDQKNENDIIEEGVITITDGWIKLEDGIEVKFNIKQDGRVRPGDYWLIPARVATGDVEWPPLTDDNGDVRVPKALPPMGIEHHYAPLAIINVSNSTVSLSSDCRCSFKTLSYNCQYNTSGRLGIGTDLICPQNVVNQ